jgi:ribonuclease HI
VTTVTQVVEHGLLPDHRSAQWAELYALTRALTLTDGKTANIYTDSHYAFATLHIHGAIYKERGLLTSRGKEIKNSQQILQLLEALWKPPEPLLSSTVRPISTNQEKDWQTG